MTEVAMSGKSVGYTVLVTLQPDGACGVLDTSLIEAVPRGNFLLEPGSGAPLLQRNGFLLEPLAVGMEFAMSP